MMHTLLGMQLDDRCHDEVSGKLRDMALVLLGKGKAAGRPRIPNRAYSILVVFASALVFASISRSAEISARPEANSRPSDSGKAATPRTLSDAQIEALMKEIGIRHDSAPEPGPRPEAKSSSPHQRTWRGRHWRKYSASTENDSGEATRLMIEELQQRGVAVGPTSESGNPK